MASSDPPKLKLYANLLNAGTNDPSATTISSAPVIYRRADDGPNGGPEKKDPASAFRFQPGSIKRPQQAAKKKIPSSKPSSSVIASSDAPLPSETISEPSAAAFGPPRTTYSLADWMDDGEDVNEFLDSKRPRKKKKKHNKDVQTPRDVNWGDYYNIREWTNLDQWKTSIARIRKHNQWKDYLKSHARHSRSASGYSSDDVETTAAKSSSVLPIPVPVPFMSFAPPPNLDSSTAGDSSMLDRMASLGEQVSSVAEQRGPDRDGYDQLGIPRSELSSSLPTLLNAALEIPPTVSAQGDFNTNAPLSASQDVARVDHQRAWSLHDPPEQTAHGTTKVISRAAVRYSVPDVQLDVQAPPPPTPDDDEDVMDVDLQPDSGAGSVSKRPGQKGFAERYMAKLGYKKGQGLGASGTGITTALKVQTQKPKKRSDAEGGGLINRAAMGKIIGGKRNISKGEEHGKHGAMSTVIKLDNILDGMDLDLELGPDGNLVVEIGQECGDKYGTVERVYVARSVASDSKPLFVKFTSELSALRAVNALDGRLFSGNTVNARFWDAERFENGVYELPKEKQPSLPSIKNLTEQMGTDGWT